MPVAYGQEAVTLSISPTLYDMSAEPGQVWNSSLKVVNVNPFDLTVYADVVNFAPRGEGGDGQFVPIDPADQTGATFAEWFTISREPLTIPREQTVEVPFVVTVPQDASPGGHFAAILIGTRPLESEGGQTKVQTAQVITALFFARIAGEVVESGTIREFSTTKSVLGSPEVTFGLRFENKGNVHLQPQGEIRIYNMWGQERGVIPVNQFTNFGNVLPDSIRKFLFTWKGEWSISDIGRYTAIATLAYGANERQFASAETAFWVVPVKLLLSIAVVLVIFGFIMSWLVRLYVRHTLILAGVTIEDFEHVQKRSRRHAKLRAPVEAGILDLSARMQQTNSLWEQIRAFTGFLVSYRLFFLGIVLLVSFVSIVWWYIKSATTDHRPYEVIYLQSDSASGTPVSSEEIIYDQMKAELDDDTVLTPDATLPKVAIVNRSGTPGLGAEMQFTLENVGYEVVSVSADFQSRQERTVVVVNRDKYESAAQLSKLLNNAPVSVRQSDDEKEPLTVFVGSDRTF